MDELILIRPHRAYGEQVAAYRAEFLEDGSSMDGCSSLRIMEDPEEWFLQSEALADKNTVPVNWVQSTQFIAVRKSDDCLVGMIQVRHEFNDHLRKYGGHVGYSVRPSERRKGYAREMLRLVLPYCRELGLEKVLITCNVENEGSRRTILANGGVFESRVFEEEESVWLERYWVSLL